MKIGFNPVRMHQRNVEFGRVLGPKDFIIPTKAALEEDLNKTMRESELTPKGGSFDFLETEYEQELVEKALKEAGWTTIEIRKESRPGGPNAWDNRYVYAITVKA
jgi:hypothetical protein